jgi:hypothetical protein
VEAVLCHHFGKSAEGNWHREGTTATQTTQLQQQQQDFGALPVLQSALEESDWCERSSEAWPNENYEYELEWYTNRAKDLQPTHHWNMASTAFSLCCFFIWLCFSPHQGRGAKAAILDQTCRLPNSRLMHYYSLFYKKRFAPSLPPLLELYSGQFLFGAVCRELACGGGVVFV